MYKALMYLVEIHARLSQVAEGLLNRTFHFLVEDLAREMLTCFRQVRRFGMGGMLRVSGIERFLSSPIRLANFPPPP